MQNLSTYKQQFILKIGDGKLASIRSALDIAADELSDAELLLKLAYKLWETPDLWQVRFAAETLLGRMAHLFPEALDFLRNFCSRDPVWFVQEGLAYAVGEFCNGIGFKECIPLLKDWVQDAHQNVRRAVSEGIRIKPYWKNPCAAVRNEPDLIISILEPLRTDPALFVIKSVGNNLSDISLYYPEKAFDTVKTWLEETGYHKATHKIARRAFRKLIKTRKAEVLAVLRMEQYRNI